MCFKSINARTALHFSGFNCIALPLSNAFLLLNALLTKISEFGCAQASVSVIAFSTKFYSWEINTNHSLVVKHNEATIKLRLQDTMFRRMQTLEAYT